MTTPDTPPVSPATEPRTARTILRDHLSKYPALESSMRLIDDQLDAIEAEAVVAAWREGNAILQAEAAQGAAPLDGVRESVKHAIETLDESPRSGREARCHATLSTLLDHLGAAPQAEGLDDQTRRLVEAARKVQPFADEAVGMPEWTRVRSDRLRELYDAAHPFLARLSRPSDDPEEGQG